MNSILLRFGCTAALLLSAAISSAEVAPTPGTPDSRIRTANYNADEVYRVIGRVGYQLSLEFAPDESFIGLAAGDAQGLTFEAEGSHLFLKPRAPLVATNLTILTNRRHYYLDYRVEPRHIDADGQVHSADALYALRFDYPQELARQRAAESRANSEATHINTALAQPSAVINTAYFYCGPKALRPTTVTDDGVQTRFTFGARTELPAIFTRAADGTESLVNFTVTSAAILVHRLAPGFVLRRGKLVACVVNHGFSGAGDRLATGTVSQEVTRLTPFAPEAPR